MAAAAGNRALQGHLGRSGPVHRLMDSGQFRTRMGVDPRPEPNKSVRYKAIVAAVDQFHRLRAEFPARLIEVAHEVGPTEVATTHTRFETAILTTLTKIRDLCQAFLDAREGKTKQVVSKVFSGKPKQAARLRKEAAVSALRHEASTEYGQYADELLQIRRQFLDNLVGAQFLNMQVGEPLGSGANNTAYTADLDDLTQGVFKAEPKGQHADASEAAGIPEENTMGNFRAVAMFRLARLLLGPAQSLVPQTELAVANRQLGQWMGRAAGKPMAKEFRRPVNAEELRDVQAKLAMIAQIEADLPRLQAAQNDSKAASFRYRDKRDELQVLREQLAKTYSRETGDQWSTMETRVLQVDLSNADLQQQLSQLQILDMVAGQIDRHEQNYWVRELNGRLLVTAIDDDLAFGTNRDPGEFLGLGSKLPTLPPIADRAVAARILGQEGQPGITENDVATVVQGLLVPDEIDALKARFSAVKNHLQQLWDSNEVASLPGQGGQRHWGAGTVAAQPAPDSEFAAPSSYFGRLRRIYGMAATNQLLYQ